MTSNLYECPCGQTWDMVVLPFNYCPDCGTKVETIKEEE